MAIGIQQEVALQAESYRLRNKCFGDWLASISDEDIISIELVELMVNSMEYNNTGVESGINVIIECNEAILNEWFNYGLIRDDGDCELELGHVLLNNPVPVLKFIDAYKEDAGSCYETRAEALAIGICSYHWADPIEPFIAALEHNAKTADKNEWLYADTWGEAAYKGILMLITNAYVKKVNECSEYNAFIDRWHEMAK